MPQRRLQRCGLAHARATSVPTASASLTTSPTALPQPRLHLERVQHLRPSSRSTDATAPTPLPHLRAPRPRPSPNHNSRCLGHCVRGERASAQPQCDAVALGRDQYAEPSLHTRNGTMLTEMLSSANGLAVCGQTSARDQRTPCQGSTQVSNPSNPFNPFNPTTQPYG